MMLAEVMSYEAALIAAIVGVVGDMGVLWTKLSATDKRQQTELDEA